MDDRNTSMVSEQTHQHPEEMADTLMVKPMMDNCLCCEIEIKIFLLILKLSKFFLRRW